MSSVIVAGAVIGGIIGGGSGIYSISKGNRQLIKAFKKQMYYAQLNYNYNQNQLTKQETSLYHSAMDQLGQLSYNAYLNNSSVQAAQAQTGYQGRTSQAISRTISGQSLRKKVAVKDSYENAVANVRSQKEALYIDMKNSVEQSRENLSNSFTYGFKAFMQVLDSTAKGAAMGAAGGAAAGAAAGALGGTSGGIGAAAGSAGVDAVSSAGFAATSGATAGTGSAAVAGGTLGTTAVVSTGSLGVSSATVGSTGGTFLGNLNTILDQHQGLFKTLQYANTFTNNFSRRGGNYY